MRFSSSDFISPDLREPSETNRRSYSQPTEDMQRVRERLLHYIYKNHVDRDVQRQRGMSLSMELIND